MDPREVIALALADTYDIVDEEDGMYGWGLGTNAIIAALSEAGMTICGEQVGQIIGWDQGMQSAHARIDKPIPLLSALFVPLSDPQEGDK